MPPHWLVLLTSHFWHWKYALRSWYLVELTRSVYELHAYESELHSSLRGEVGGKRLVTAFFFFFFGQSLHVVVVTLCLSKLNCWWISYLGQYLGTELFLLFFPSIFCFLRIRTIVILGDGNGGKEQHFNEMKLIGNVEVLVVILFNIGGTNRDKA
jgi:hypothetical protein